jgi:hypothetical protein
MHYGGGDAGECAKEAIMRLRVRGELSLQSARELIVCLEFGGRREDSQARTVWRIRLRTVSIQ